MSSLESEENRCLICLEEDVDVHWSAVLYGYSDLTYKDCYYKYTQLEYFDENNFSTMLCRNCSNGLEYIDAFISKAIETNEMLHERFRINIKDDGDNMKPEPSNFETIVVEDTEIKPEIHNPVHEYSNEELFTTTAENKTCSRSETPITQTRKQQKRKSIKKEKGKDFNSKHQTTDDASLLDEKKRSKKTEQPICCTICSKVLASKYKAIKHEQTHIKNRERNETCVECGLKFYSKEILKSHMLTHLENREKNHKCEFCDKAFYSKGGLNVHRRIHLGQMISCSLCTKQFYRQIDLDKHMNSHSAVRINSTIKTRSRCFIRCKDCGKNIRSTSFKYHNAKHMNKPLFKCSICNKEFFHRCSCVKHLKRTHKKANEDIINFVIAYKTNRISHLYLQQNTNIQDNDKIE